MLSKVSWHLETWDSWTKKLPIRNTFRWLGTPINFDVMVCRFLTLFNLAHNFGSIDISTYKPISSRGLSNSISEIILYCIDLTFWMSTRARWSFVAFRKAERSQIRDMTLFTNAWRSNARIKPSCIQGPPKIIQFLILTVFIEQEFQSFKRNVKHVKIELLQHHENWKSTLVLQILIQ